MMIRNRVKVFSLSRRVARNGSYGRNLTQAAFFLCALLVAGLFGGCGSPLFGGNDDDDDDDGLLGSYVTNVEPIETILGFGYDVFDTFADPNYIKTSPILDLGKLYNDKRLMVMNYDKTEYLTTSGVSTSTYLENLATKASLSGSYKYFSGSATAAFTSALATSTEYQYATIHTDIVKALYTVKGGTLASTMRGYLDADFAACLEGESQITPAELFATFGTHAMVGVVMGGRLDFNLAAKNSTSQTTTTISAYAQAKYKTLFSKGAASCSFDTTAASSTSFSDQYTSTTAIGGDSTLAVGNSDDNFTLWLASIADTPNFCGYGANGLLPIWKLCGDATRAAEIEAAFATWSDDRYKENLGLSSTGTLVVAVDELYNQNVGDDGTPEFVWDVRLLSAYHNETYSIGTPVTSYSKAVQIAEGKAQAINSKTTLYHIPISASTSITITPRLEETDGSGNLGSSTNNNSPNDLYCTTSSGPMFTFHLADQKWSFTAADVSGAQSKYGFISTTRSAVTVSEPISIGTGDTRTFYIILKQFNGVSSGEWISFKMTVSWTADPIVS